MPFIQYTLSTYQEKKVTRYNKRWKVESEETEQARHQKHTQKKKGCGNYQTGNLEKNYAINMPTALVETVDRIQEHMGNISRDGNSEKES